MITKLFNLPPDSILKEQVELVYRNHLAGLFGFAVVALIGGAVVYSETNRRAVLIWVAVMLVTTIVLAIRHIGFRDKESWQPRRDMWVMTSIVMFHSLVWSYLPLTTVPDASHIVVAIMITLSAGFTAGAVSMDSPCVPVFIGFAYPCMLALIIGLFQRPEWIYWGIAFGSILYLMALTFFAVNTERTIRQSIELRLENDALVSQLRSALQATEEANKAKSVFLASASHDLRQPLHAIGLLTDTMGNSTLSAQLQQIHSHMRTGIDSMSEMLEALLNFSKIDAGVITAEVEAFLVAPVFKKIASEMLPAAEEKGLYIRTRETIVAAESDVLIVEMIVRNLLANALRYTERGGVLLACRERNGKLSIEVWDTGIGIAEHEQGNIFKDFYQINNYERDAKRGFGLGLAIAQGLAHTINSNIIVSSAPGRGSVFRFDVPRAEVSFIDDVPSQERPARVPPLTIMVVDDNEGVRNAATALLTSWGCHCHAAAGLAEALALVGKHQFDVMLVDYRLRGGVTGKDVVAAVREQLKQSLPAIIITGDTAADRLQEAISVNALLLHKPASATQLQRMLIAAVES